MFDMVACDSLRISHDAGAERQRGLAMMLQVTVVR